SLTWKIQAYENRWTPGPMFDFVSLGEAVRKAIEAKYSFEVQSQLYCQYGGSSVHLSELACNCAAGKTNCTEEVGTLNVGGLCGFYPLSLFSPPFTLHFSASSSNLFGVCTT